MVRYVFRKGSQISFLAELPLLPAIKGAVSAVVSDSRVEGLAEGGEHLRVGS